MQVLIRFLLSVFLFFLVNTVIVALSPAMATAERGYVNQTASWGGKLRGQVQNNSLSEPIQIFTGRN